MSRRSSDYLKEAAENWTGIVWVLSILGSAVWAIVTLWGLEGLVIVLAAIVLLVMVLS